MFFTGLVPGNQSRMWYCSIQGSPDDLASNSETTGVKLILLTFYHIEENLSPSRLHQKNHGIIIT